MRKTAILLVALASMSAFADEYVQGHYRKDGTYVQGYHRTAPDSNPYNNYSTQGNINPYTGRAGTVNPYEHPQQPIYVAPPVYQPPQCGYTSDGRYICR